MYGQQRAYCLEDLLNGMSPNNSGLVAMGRFNSSPESYVTMTLHKQTMGDIMKILKEGNPLLNEEVTKLDGFGDNLRTANQMLRWIVSHKLILQHTVGLASNQLGLRGRVILVRHGLNDGFKILINPSFEHIGTVKSKVVESCLSVKGDYEVSRWDYIRVFHEVWNLNGRVENPVKTEYFNSSAGASIECHVIQHEIDHLDGILISQSGKEIL
jgi:peptide deformylase